MRETDSTKGAMVDSSSNIMFQARNLLATPSHEGLAIAVNQLSMPQESVEYQAARALYDFCVANFSNCLTLKLLQVYRHSSDDVVRFRSIYCLSETLTDLRNGIKLSLVALPDIKPLVISCLTMKNATESETKILRRIVSFVANDVLVLHNGRWNELGDCIFSLANSDPLRAFNIFLDLPPVDLEFTDRFEQKLLEGVYRIFFNPEKYRFEDWTLAVETAVKLGIQLLKSKMKEQSDLAQNILCMIEESANELVTKGMEHFLQRGLEDLHKFLSQDPNLCKWTSYQCNFVSEFASMISGIGTHTKEAANKFFQMVTKLDNHAYDPAFKLSPPLVQSQSNLCHGEGFYRDLYNKLKPFSALEVLHIFESANSDDISREIALRRLHVLLCNHTSGEVDIDASEMRKIQPLLISCLRKEGISDGMFKILGQVVFHVAKEIFDYTEDPWRDLWDYIASECKTGFERAVYIFQCLTMQLDDKTKLMPAMMSLIPVIYKRLNPPKEVLMDNSCWVLAFNGAFCGTIHLVQSTNHTKTVEKMACKMIDSVKELVERGMEVGLVTRAFRDMELIVKKQLKWYSTSEYKFLKGLLWKLYAIKGMKWESKIVLWRINVVLERKQSSC